MLLCYTQPTDLSCLHDKWKPLLSGEILWSNKADKMVRTSYRAQYNVIKVVVTWFEYHVDMISVPKGNRLTWLLCGGIDGRRLWPRASRIECSYREVVSCVCSQPCDVNQRVVSRNAHFANSVRFGVVFPVHNLMGRKNTGAFHCII